MRRTIACLQQQCAWRSVNAHQPATRHDRLYQSQGHSMHTSAEKICTMFVITKKHSRQQCRALIWQNATSENTLTTTERRTQCTMIARVQKSLNVCFRSFTCYRTQCSNTTSTLLPKFFALPKNTLINVVISLVSKKRGCCSISFGFSDTQRGNNCKMIRENTPT